MTLPRKPSVLTHRPKTSSAVDDATASASLRTDMKRTASQTFSPVDITTTTTATTATTALCDAREGATYLGSVKEGMPADYAPLALVSPPATSYTSSFSRASHNIVGSCKQICRRLSASSTRRPSLTASTAESAPTTRKPSPDALHPRLLHHDSGIPTPNNAESSASSFSSVSTASAAGPGLHSKFAAIKRFGSIRHRRPATSGPSGDFARYNPIPAPVPSNYPTIAPGQAARAAAAAANNERLMQKRQEEQQTSAFLAGSLRPAHDIDEVIKDSESGVGMSCSSPITRTDSVQEKKLDPIHYLPAEITSMILANLDAPSLIQAEGVSQAWNEAATSSHVWRAVFLRRFEPEVHVTPTPILMGGAGVGQWQGRGRPVPGQNWKKMYQVRMTINRRWRGCSPSAIYLNGHTDSVYCCQFDENKIITGSRDRTIRVWDMKTYKCIKVIGGPLNKPVLHTPIPLETHKETVVSHPSMNGKEEGDAIYQVPMDYHEASILCLQYDDKIMVTGSSDHTCIVWDITGDIYRPITRLRGHNAGVLDVALDEKYIVSCSKDATINVWDRQTYKCIRSLTGHRGPVNAVQLRGHLLVSASGDGIAKLWNLQSGACIKEFPSQDRGLAAVEFSDDAKYVLAGGNDHVVYKFDALTGNLLHTSTKHGGLVRSLFLDAHNGRVISGSYDQSIRIADYHSGEVFGLYENWTTSWILSAKSDYRRVVATSQDGRALILDFGWQVDGKELLVGDQ